MKIQIVIPSINLWYKYTKPCIDSIKTKHEYHIFLVDNNSTDETKEQTNKLVGDNFGYIHNTQSWCCSKSWNYGIRDGFERGCDYVLVLNNDVLLHPEAIDKLVERFEKGGVTMVTCNNIKGQADNPADFFRWLSNSREGLEETEHPDFSGFMINKECWEKVGPFDENFKPCYFEDNDYHHRIQIAGLKAINLPTAMFYHFGSSTQNEALPVRICSHQAFNNNRDYYIKKWGGNPGAETFPKPFNEV